MTQAFPVPDLAHIRGPRTPPFVGNTLRFLRDSYGFSARNVERFGEVYRVCTMGRPRVVLNGADAVEFVLNDRDGNFSSAEGWDVISPLFSGGLMLRDFDDHRRHRRVMQAAFKAGAMRDYLARMAPEIDRLVDEWPTGSTFRFYPAVKTLTLRMGGAVFMGLSPDDPETSRLNRALVDELAAAFGVVRHPLPFTKMGRGMKQRRRLSARFASMIAERRRTGGDDFFSRMCVARDEDGAAWTDVEIVDHFNFLMMAAHDTTSTALTAMAWGLAEHPEWQDRVRSEVDAIEGPLDEAALASMTTTERVFKEALRLVPPVPFIPRRAVRAFEWRGVRVPAGTPITVMPGLVMLSPEYWTEPESFDPDRFSPNRAEDRSHRYAWAPFGGGAHKCIGMHFSTMQAKAFTVALLRRHRLVPAWRRPVEWQRMPMPYPRGGLPVRLVPRRA